MKNRKNTIPHDSLPCSCRGHDCLGGDGPKRSSENDADQAQVTISDPERIRHESQWRTYRIVTPKPAIKGKQVNGFVVLLHGHGGSADQVLGLNNKPSPFRSWFRIAKRESLMLIVPDGVISPDGHRGWNDGRRVSTNPTTNDIDFVNSLVDHVRKTAAAPTAPAYISGISNGGHLSLRLAAESSHRYVAVAPIVAANPDPIFSKSPTHPVSVMLIAGTGDTFVPYAGGSVRGNRGKVQSVDATIDYWRSHNQCDEIPLVQS